jgi:hypothetical protein
MQQGHGLRLSLFPQTVPKTLGSVRVNITPLEPLSGRPLPPCYTSHAPSKSAPALTRPGASGPQSPAKHSLAFLAPHWGERRRESRGCARDKAKSWTGTGLNRRHQDFQTRRLLLARTNDLSVSVMIRSLQAIDPHVRFRIRTDSAA